MILPIIQEGEWISKFDHFNQLITAQLALKNIAVNWVPDIPSYPSSAAVPPREVVILTCAFLKENLVVQAKDFAVIAREFADSIPDVQPIEHITIFGSLLIFQGGASAQHSFKFS